VPPSPGPFATISESHPTSVWLHCMHAHALVCACMRCMHPTTVMATLDEVWGYCVTVLASMTTCSALRPMLAGAFT